MKVRLGGLISLPVHCNVVIIAVQTRVGYIAGHGKVNCKSGEGKLQVRCTRLRGTVWIGRSLKVNGM